MLVPNAMNRMRIEVAIEDRHTSETLGAQVPAVHGAPSTAPVLSAKGAARRRWAKAGAGTTGVLLTLYSQPGMACTYCGLKPSGALSAMDQGKTAAQLSHHAPCTEGGRLPSYWAGVVPSNILFGDFFACTSIPFANVQGKALLNGEVVCMDRSNNYAVVTCNTNYQKRDIYVAQYLAAAMANYQQGLVKTVDVEILQGIWKQWSASRSYSPVPGRTWSDQDIIAYLRGTMD